MPSIHPSEDPALGWLVPCLAVADLSASLDFYAKLDLLPWGGEPSAGWSMLRNRAVEIHLFQGHIPKDLLNFRGGDPDAIRAALSARGLVVHRQEGERSFLYLDPDGREVFFDSTPEESAAYEAGQALTMPVPASEVHSGTGLDLGNPTCCLKCADLKATLAFYRTLGLVLDGGDPEQGWAILTRVDHPKAFGTRLATTSIALFQGMIPADMLNLRGGNVGALARTLAERGADLGDGVQIAPDGGESLMIVDPDGRPILFDTTPPERLYAD